MMKGVPSASSLYRQQARHIRQTPLFFSCDEDAIRQEKNWAVAGATAQ